MTDVRFDKHVTTLKEQDLQSYLPHQMNFEAAKVLVKEEPADLMDETKIMVVTWANASLGISNRLEPAAPPFNDFTLLRERGRFSTNLTAEFPNAVGRLFRILLVGRLFDLVVDGARGLLTDEGAFFRDEDSGAAGSNTTTSLCLRLFVGLSLSLGLSLLSSDESSSIWSRSSADALLSTSSLIKASLASSGGINQALIVTFACLLNVRIRRREKRTRLQRWGKRTRWLRSKKFFFVLAFLKPQG